MENKIWLIISGMAVATYIPRAVPAVLIDKMNFGAKTEKFLKLIPYTALTALVFPGVAYVDAARPEIGIVGAVVAAVLAWLRVHIILCVMAAILADFVLYYFM